MVRKLFSFIIGYFYIQIEGFYIEKFINICMKQNIFLWGIKRDKIGSCFAKIGRGDFEKAKEIASKNQVILTVKRKVGAKFIIEKYKKRKALAVALILIIALIFTLSKFIWKIEIKINENRGNLEQIQYQENEKQADNNKENEEIIAKKKEIFKLLKEEGIRVGILKKKIKIEKVINDIRMKRNDISWIGIRIDGCKLTIEIVLAIEKPDIVDEKEYTNIVAKKDGEVIKITAQNGTAIVKKGDHVKKGDILIAGYMDGEHVERSYVNANGEVKGKIIYSETAKIEKKETEKYKTGKKRTKFSIKFNNFKINFFKRLSNFEIYDTIYTNKNIFSNSKFQIEFIKYDVFEEAVKETENSKEEAEKKGKIISEEKLNKKVEGEIINKNTEVTDYDTYYLVMVKYEVIEDIGTKEEINF